MVPLTGFKLRTEFLLLCTSFVFADFFFVFCFKVDSFPVVVCSKIFKKKQKARWAACDAS